MEWNKGYEILLKQVAKTVGFKVEFWEPELHRIIKVGETLVGRLESALAIHNAELAGINARLDRIELILMQSNAMRVQPGNPSPCGDNDLESAAWLASPQREKFLEE